MHVEGAAYVAALCSSRVYYYHSSADNSAFLCLSSPSSSRPLILRSPPTIYAASASDVGCGDV